MKNSQRPVIITLVSLYILIISILQIESYTKNKNNEKSSNWKTCVYNDEDDEVVENAPWTSTINIQKHNQKLNFFPSAILNEYTIITYGRPFVGPGNKLELLPWKNYTIYVGPTTNSNPNLSNPIQVSYVKPYSKIHRDTAYWQKNLNDFVLIYLKTPINFTYNVRPTCIPPSISNWTQHKEFLKVNSSILVAGWRKSFDLDLISLNLKLNSFEECERVWYERDDTMDYNFINRLCGYGTVKGNKNNPTKKCINKDSGTIFKSEQDSKYYFIGFISTFYGNGGFCDEKSFHYISLASPDVLTWVQYGIKCGPFQYTCDNGQCVPLNSICNQSNQCEDGSDEDPKYCRGLKYCNDETQFECGIYGDCIPQKNADGKIAANCDGVRDCPNGEDEEPPMCALKESIKPLTVGLIGAALGTLFIIPISVFIWRRSKRHRNMTAEEISEFYNGEDPNDPKEQINNEDDTLLDVRKLPYDRSFEYDPKDCPLGPIIDKGEFGVVRLAKLRSDTVVVKIPLKGAVDIDQIKALLVELKFNIYVQLMGGHENVVNLVGAYTQQIRKRVLHVAFEYCEHGNLLGYVKKNRQYFKNEFNESGNKTYFELLPKPGYIFTDSLIHFTTMDLIQWAIHISKGMAFLLSKKIVHGDLALRNILLDSKRTAKICDFGLSRQLYNYNVYTMKTQVSIPWQWMPIEVLESNTFHIKSDVWSYGITLWELFNLGSEPWAGMQCSPIFIQQLKANFRLYKPEFGNDQIFNIITKCWNSWPEQRPDFIQIGQELGNILDISEIYSRTDSTLSIYTVDGEENKLENNYESVSVSIDLTSSEENLPPDSIKDRSHLNENENGKLSAKYLSFESVSALGKSEGSVNNY